MNRFTIQLAIENCEGAQLICIRIGEAVDFENVGVSRIDLRHSNLFALRLSVFALGLWRALFACRNRGSFFTIISDSSAGDFPAR